MIGNLHKTNLGGHKYGNMIGKSIKLHDRYRIPHVVSSIQLYVTEW